MEHGTTGTRAVVTGNTALRRLMQQHDRGPAWVSRRLREFGVEVTRSTVHRWSTGERTLPAYAIPALAKVFGVRQKDLRDE